MATFEIVFRPNLGLGQTVTTRTMEVEGETIRVDIGHADDAMIEVLDADKNVVFIIPSSQMVHARRLTS